MDNILDKIKRNESPTRSKWREAAKFRQNNKDWLKISQFFAMFVLNIMEDKKLSQKAIALKAEVSQQYISKVLKGSENLSLETIIKILKSLDVDLKTIFDFVFKKLSNEELDLLSKEIYNIKSQRLLDEESRLIKEKEEIELTIQKLRDKSIYIKD